MTTIHLEANSISPTMPVALNVHLVTTLNVTADEARGRVNRQIVTDLGTGLIARAPELVITAEKIVWRVPIALSLPELGDLGQVGTVDVDAQTGEITTGTDTQAKIIQHARWLYNGATLQAE